jgi:tripartite-type tricarboxylate transporter receptor subunit TctC
VSILLRPAAAVSIKFGVNQSDLRLAARHGPDNRPARRRAAQEKGLKGVWAIRGIFDEAGGENIVTRCVALFLASLAVTPQACADPVADFYKGRTITLIVGYGPGGGYDLFARLVARHLGRYLAGNPTVMVQNMPGAGSLRATNYLYAVAPRDGATIGSFARDMPLLAILRTNASVVFDPRKFNWLGSSSDFSRDAYILMVRKDAPVSSIEDARRRDGPPIVLGGTAEGATGSDIPLVLRDALGINIKLVTGYPDNGAIFLAVDRGEVNGRTADLSSMKSLKPEWLLPNGPMRALVQFARATRHPEFADVPTARDLARDEDARALIEFAELSYKMSRPFAAPPGVPAERVEALRQAFAAVQKDRGYLEEAAKLRLEVSPIGGEEVLQTIDHIAAAPPNILDRLRRLIMGDKGGG